MTAPPRPRDQVATLAQTFFSRFFDNDVTGDARDMKTMFFALLAVLAVPGALVPFLLANPTQTQPGWDLVALERGVDVLRAISRADKAFYLGFAMIAAGMVSALTWTALIVDRRDGLILGGLPVRSRAIVFAKLVALAGFVSVVAVAMHAAASISFGTFLASHNTVGFAVRGIAAHFVASCGASAFVVLTAAALQGLTLTLLGPRVFRRASPALQMVLVGGVLVMMITLPDVSGAVVATLGGDAGREPWILWTPPLWFLGVYETILGTTDRTLLGLAETAAIAIGIPLVVAAATYPLAYRRLMRAVVEQPETVSRFTMSSALIGALTRVIGRAPEIRAVAQFYVSALVRDDRQRLVLATAVGLAVVWGVPAWMAQASGAGMAQIDLLSWAVTAPLFVVAGLRMAAALPAGTAGAWVFDVLPPSAQHVRAAMERVILLVGVAPAIVLFSLVIWRWWGGEAAAVHALFSSATSFLFLQALTLFWRFDRVPCTRAWDVGAMNLRLWWPVYMLVFIVLTRGLPRLGGLPDLDLALMHSPIAAACVIAVTIALAVRVRRWAVFRQRTPANEPTDVLAWAMRARRLSRQAAEPDDRGSPGAGRDGAAAPSLLEPPVRGRRPDLRDSWRNVAAGVIVPWGVLRRDVLLALRRLRRTPVFTAFSVLTLGGGVAATTLAFAVVHALVWTRPPIAEFDRLVDLSGERFAGQRGRDRGPFSWPDFLDLREQQTTFASLAASTWHEVSFVGGGASAVVNAGAVSGEFFRTFGLRAAAGRLIEPDDDRPDAERVVVLSYTLWRLRFGADPRVVGTIVRVNGDLYRVIGVAPRGFSGADLSNVGRAGAIWVPLQTASGEVPFFRNGRRQTVRQLLDAGDRDARWLGIKARLAPGRTIEQASAEVRAIGRRVEGAFPTPRQGEANAPPILFGRRWSADEPRDDRPLAAGRLFIALVGFVLLIGATNLANLALARGAAREHEIAVRRALGASRVDLIREHVVETAFVGLAAAGLAWLLVTALAKRLILEIPGRSDQFLLLEPLVSGPVIVFAAITGLAALLTAGLWPALQVTGSRLRAGLSTAGATTPPHWRLHRRLIQWQVAGSSALLFLAAACVSALMANARHAPGVEVDRLALADFSFSDNRFDRLRAREVIEAVLADVRRSPDVAAAAASAELPFDGGRAARQVSATRTDEPLAPSADPHRLLQLVATTPELFRTLGVDVVRGRSFGPGDTAASSLVGVVNEAFARRLWGTADVTGRDFVLWPPRDERESGAQPFQRITIVGVASDTDAGVAGSREAGILYVPMDQHSISRAVFTVRAADDDPEAALAALRATIARAAPGLVLDEIGTGPRLLGRGTLMLTLVASIVTSIGGVALLLAMTGLFGIVSELVSRRMREFGVRSALGASQCGIVRLVLLDGIRPVLGGLALGAFAGAVVRSIIASTLSLPMRAVDSVEFVTVSALLIAAGAAACYWPARRAARADPAVALRTS